MEYTGFPVQSALRAVGVQRRGDDESCFVCLPFHLVVLLSVFVPFASVARGNTVLILLPRWGGGGGMCEMFEGKCGRYVYVWLQVRYNVYPQ